MTPGRSSRLGLALLACAPVAGASAALDGSHLPLQEVQASKDTGHKPQSKVWRHAGSWWAVLPRTDGTWLWRLEPDLSWTRVRRLSDSGDARADVKVVGDVVHVLLEERSTELVSLEFDETLGTYGPWSVRPATTDVVLGANETATIDVDTTGHMWLATEDGTDIRVYHAAYPYTSFQGPLVLASGTRTDDISLVVSLPDASVGVFWSNQATRRFGFRVHADGDPPGVWSADERPASQSALNVGAGQADDHMNAAVGSDGTLYLAVKTGYDTSGFPKIALLVRRPDGSWDDLVEVDQLGTRPIVLLNEVAGTLQVVYTENDGVHPIVYRESALDPLAFGPKRTLTSGAYNDVTSQKDPWSGEVVILYRDAFERVGGVLLCDPFSPSPPLDLVAHYRLGEGTGTTLVDASPQGNDGTYEGSPQWSPGVDCLALELDGLEDGARIPSSPSLELGPGATLAAWIRPAALADQVLVDKGIGTTGYRLRLTGQGEVLARLNGSAAQSLSSSSSYASRLGSWLHVAATYDGAVLRLYLDGREDASLPFVGTLLPSGADLFLGRAASGGERLTGRLDDVRLHDRALSPAEVTALAAHEPSTLAADLDEVSLSAGGTQFLCLDAGAALAGSAYLVLGSTSGTSPGFQLQGFGIPLVPDPYLRLTLRHANSGHLVGTRGALDGNGRALAGLAFPAGSDPALAGLGLDHAFLAFDLSPFTARLVSDPVHLLLVP